jgi:hypothetical protein
MTIVVPPLVTAVLLLWSLRLTIALLTTVKILDVACWWTRVVAGWSCWGRGFFGETETTLASGDWHLKEGVSKAARRSEVESHVIGTGSCCRTPHVMILYVSWMGKENGEIERELIHGAQESIPPFSGVSVFPTLVAHILPYHSFSSPWTKLDLIFPRPTVDIMSTTANPNVMALGESHDETSHV